MEINTPPNLSADMKLDQFISAMSDQELVEEIHSLSVLNFSQLNSYMAKCYSNLLYKLHEEQLKRLHNKIIQHGRIKS